MFWQRVGGLKISTVTRKLHTSARYTYHLSNVILCKRFKMKLWVWAVCWNTSVIQPSSSGFDECEYLIIEFLVQVRQKKTLLCPVADCSSNQRRASKKAFFIYFSLEFWQSQSYMAQTRFMGLPLCMEDWRVIIIATSKK